MEATKPIDTTAAQAYEKFLVPAVNEPLAREAVAIASPQSGESVLDACCGTGIAARLAIPCVAPRGRVAGLDMDPGMIEVARSLAHAPVDVNLDWYCASAMQMPFDVATFDVIFCLQGLQFLPDCTAGLAEMRRVMKPGGRLVAAVWRTGDHCKGQYAIVQALARRNLDTTPILKALSMGDAEKLGKHAAGAGFKEVNIRTASIGARFASTRKFIEAFAAGGPASRHAISKVPQSQTGEFYDEVTSALQVYEDNKGVLLPMAYLALIARP